MCTGWSRSENFLVAYLTHDYDAAIIDLTSDIGIQGSVSSEAR